MHTSYHFHHYHLLPAPRQLLAAGRPVRLGSRAFDALVVLVERRDRIVTKGELMALVWPRLVVEENNLAVHVLALRKLLGHGAIATIPGRGYRFALPVVAENTTTVPAPGLAPDEPPPAREGNLQGRIPELLGREHELHELHGLIRSHAVVTVTGAGGIGKTRLAQGAAAARASEQAVWWVELAPLADASLVPTAVARALALSVGPEEDATQAIVRALRGKAALLVLDNAEHLIDAVAAFVATLRDQASGVKLLVTSQEVMRGLEEQVYRPGPLALPQGDEFAEVRASGAVALFVARARQADPRFELRDDNRAAVADICRRLDGIPLAIELAAARLPLLGVDGLRARLDERFQILTAGSRAVMRRHQTLRAALEWSHALLTADEQRVFRRLGVFVGGFSLEGSQAVAMTDNIDGIDDIDAWDVLEHLGVLVDKSLVVAEGDSVPRYRLLESMRLYALERLAEAGETDAVLRLHLDHALALAEAVDPNHIDSVATADAVMRLDAEHDNLMHALAWSSRAADPQAAAAGLRLAAALHYYWGARGLLHAGLAATRRALAHTASLPADAHRCVALASAVQLLHWTGQDAEAGPLLEELLSLGRTLGDEPAVIVARIHQGHLAASQNDVPGARTHFQAARGLARGIGHLRHEGTALAGLADLLLEAGQMDEAAALNEELLALRRRDGNGYNLALTLRRVASLAMARGDTVRAVALLAECQPLVREAGSRVLLCVWGRAVGSLCASQRHWEAAVRLLAWARCFSTEQGLAVDSRQGQAEQAQLDQMRGALGGEAYDAAWAAGAALSAEGVLELGALALVEHPS